jgi:hypothetical protein
MNIGDEILLKTKFMGVGDASGNLIYVGTGFTDANKSSASINKPLIVQCTCPPEAVLCNCPLHG